MIQKQLSPIEREYAEVLNEIRKQKKGSNIDDIVINFLKRQIKEIKEGKRKDVDIGDAFGIFIQNENTGRGSFSEEIENLLFDLGDYKVEINGKVLVGELGIESIEDVEKELNNIMEKLSN